MNKWLEINTRKAKYNYQNAFDSSLQYFNGDELAASTFVGKYALLDPEKSVDQYVEINPDMMHERLASEIARIDCNYKFGKEITDKALNTYVEGTTQDFPLLDCIEYCNERLDFYYSYLKDFKKIVLQGSPSYGVGNRFVLVSLSNCVVSDSPEDSVSSINRTANDMMNLFKARCGVGVDISGLRPEGVPTSNSSKSSTGAWSWSNYLSDCCRMIGQAGRRGAEMITLDIKHPDTDKFTTMKSDLTFCTGANVSLKIRNDFMNAVVNHEEWITTFPLDLDHEKYIAEHPGDWISASSEISVDSKGLDITRKLKSKIWVNDTVTKDRVMIRKVDSEDLWMLINECAKRYAEPGLLFWDNYMENLPACCYEQFVSTSVNPCSELSLSPNDSCRLTTLNVLGFIIDPFRETARFDYESFRDATAVGMRIMDNIVDLEIECLTRIRNKVDEPSEKLLWGKLIQAAIDGRRTGLGGHAYADMLAQLRIKYDSEESLQFTSNLEMTFRDVAYDTSCDLAEERGAFPVFDWEKEKNNQFIKRLPQRIQDRLAKTGRRNISLLTHAPTGTVSILCQCSSGIEPVFRNFYTRRKKINPSDINSRVDFTDQNGDKWQEFSVFHHNILKYFEVYPEIKKQWEELESTTPVKEWSNALQQLLPDYFVQSGDIDPIMRVRLQGGMQQYVDHGISSTINLPKGTTTQTVANIYMESWKAGLKGITVYVDGSRSGVLVSNDTDVKSTNKIIITHAPKRPKELEADIHRSIIDGKKWLIFVGLLDGMPYEIFGGLAENVEIPKRTVKGKIVKRKEIDPENPSERYNVYDLVYGEDDDPILIRDIVKTFKNEDYATATRNISLELRHGISPEYIVEQNRKDQNQGLYSFFKVTARVLSKYLMDKETGLMPDFCKSGNCE